MKLIEAKYMANKKIKIIVKKYEIIGAKEGGYKFAPSKLLFGRIPVRRERASNGTKKMIFNESLYLDNFSTKEYEKLKRWMQCYNISDLETDILNKLTDLKFIIEGN